MGSWWRRMISRWVLFTAFLLILCICCSPVLAAPQNFIVATSELGQSYSLLSPGGGALGSQVKIDDLNKLEDYFNYSWSTGIGDFDNDGDFDYIIATGDKSPGNIYLYNNTGLGPTFTGPFLIGIWEEGDDYIPSDLAVADFNEDGNLDFIITHARFFNSELYLGDGSMHFTRTVLTETEPFSNGGADAADIDNNGNMDFVVMPWLFDQYDHTIHVNLGNGNGNFRTITIAESSKEYWGCALADVNNDYNVDLIATANQVINIFTGDGTGDFVLWKTIDDPNIGPYSPVDNYDLSGDGNQDLVIGNYQDLGTVAVFLGDGMGNFTFNAAYPGAGSSGRESISAAPYIQPSANKPPVACVKPASKTVNTGEWVCFDACCSKDPDGSIVSYEWAFGDGSTGTGKNVKHRFTQPGVYTVTLTVTDDKGAKATATSTITVSPIKATVDFIPKILKLNCKGEYVTATISLPKPYDARKINIKDVGVRYGDSPIVYAINNPKWKFSHRCEMGKNGWNVLIVKFDKCALVGVIPEPSVKTVLHVTGTVQYGGKDVPFDGSDTIRTIMERKKTDNNNGQDNKNDHETNDDNGNREKN
jgi:PKD repeat protein